MTADQKHIEQKTSNKKIPSIPADDFVKTSLELLREKKYDEALSVGKAILLIDPSHLEGLHIVGLAHLRLGNFKDSIRVLQQVVERQPCNGHAFLRLGQALHKNNDHPAAVSAFDKAEDMGIADETLTAQRFNSAALALKDAQNHCNWKNLSRLTRILREGLLSSRWISGEAILASESFSNAMLLRATTNHARQLTRSAKFRKMKFQTRSDKIRLGFAGQDFFEQATAYLMNGFIESLDRTRFEVFAYDYGPARKDTQFRKRTVNAYDKFYIISDLSDDAAAQKINDDGVDILFSIKSPSEARLGIFARRPSPIQVHYLYYPGTSGMPFFDYILADNFVIPDGLENAYSERVVKLQGCYQPNDGKRSLPQMKPRSEWGASDDAVIMANFNQTYKITPQMFDLWCLLLRGDKKRILWLLCEHEEARVNLKREALSRGVSGERIFFWNKTNLQEHFNRLRCADLILDTFPYGGHTLTSDALWSGTPVLTLCGDTFASRVAGSLLQNVELDYLICNNELEYLTKADILLKDASKRKEYRGHLDTGRSKFPLFSSKNYAARFEKLMLQLIKRHSDPSSQPIQI